jgi:DTW domain-containing protein YfiP
MPIGTARMASLSLPNSELHVGVNWQHSTALLNAISDPQRPALLLYPGDDATDVTRQPPVGPVTLVVVDGTWSQAKKMIRENPILNRLPRFTFQPPNPSEYRIRREPKPHCVSTIEALVFALGALEGDSERFRSLLLPFRQMIDRQIELKELNHSFAGRRVIKKKRAPPNIPVALRERRDDIVCVVGEANAWPWCAAEFRTTYPDELIHWVAQRLSTGETFESIVAPRNPLAPNTTKHISLDAAQLHTGGTVKELLSNWRGFIRETDILCSWGCHATNLLASSGGYLPPLRFDLRGLAKDLLKQNIGTIDRFLMSIDENPCLSHASGRAGVRLGELVRIAECFTEGKIIARSQRVGSRSDIATLK